MKPLKIARFVRKLDPTFHRKAFDLNKKRLKISKGQSETVYQRRTDNTMAKRKKYKRTNNDRRNIYTYKTKDRVTRNPLKKPGVNLGAPEGYVVPAPLVAPVVLI